MSKDSTDYIGDFIYHNNKFSKYNWGNGYIVPTGSSSGYAYRFYIRDHQGNNRVVTSYTGVVQQTTHYYQDGVTHDKSTEQGLQRYKYNGKELDRLQGLNLYDYGARQYDPTIGQFTSMDSLCEADYRVSPYSNCGVMLPTMNLGLASIKK
jgi:RHS repeat-associated protein